MLSSSNKVTTTFIECFRLKSNEETTVSRLFGTYLYPSKVENFIKLAKTQMSNYLSPDQIHFLRHCSNLFNDWKLIFQQLESFLWKWYFVKAHYVFTSNWKSRDSFLWRLSFIERFEDKISSSNKAFLSQRNTLG